MINSEYKEHEIFAELSKYADFYKSLSSSIFQFISQGTSAICNLDSYLISSIQGTIESIKLILKGGKINDSYALTRKYYDSVVINIYEILYLADNFSIENFIVQKINNWLHGKEKLPNYREMIEYIRNSTRLGKVNKILDLDNHYKIVRNRCNDHIHYNLFHYMMMNDKQIYMKDRLKILNELSCDIRDIFIKHFIWLFTLNEHYMTSSDYLDSLECGVIPEEGSQYYVAPFIQDIFNDTIKKYRMDLALELKNATCMKLE